VIDLKLLKDNPQVIEDMLKRRKLDFPIKELIALDKRRRELISEIQGINHNKNILAHSIAAKKKTKEKIAQELEEMNVIRNKIVSLDVEKSTVDSKFRHLIMEGAIILGDFEDVIYKVEGEDLYMLGTSEHAMASMHMNEILDGKKLPIKYAGISPCFRKEAGAHGKDMKGIFRVHQFEKVEQFIYSRPELAWKEHEDMLTVTQEFYEKLGIPYRVVLLCSAELGKVSAKTYDIEAWMPSQNAYREIGSCSNCSDYQARSLGIRFRDKTNEETRLVHTLNSTLVATERTLVTILENYQTSKGTVEVPDVLQKYMGYIKEISL
jgi:seryl-tRNA synthetase